MTAPFISVRTDVAANPSGERLIDLKGGWVRCTYGEALDGAEECTLVLPHDHPAVGSLAIRNVIRIRNELDHVHEYRIRHLYDSLTSPTITIKASPILHDLGDVRLQRLVGETWTSHFTASLSPRDWVEIICENMAQRGQPWWTPGDIDVDGTAGIAVAGESCLAIARRLVEGTLATVLAERDGDTAIKLSLRMLLPETRPLVIVGKNVEALDREIHANLQTTIVEPAGMTAPGDTSPQGIEEMPWVITDNPAPGVLELTDTDASAAQLAIEDDQYVGDPGIAYPDRALAGNCLPPTRATITGGASGGSLNFAADSRCHDMARVGDKLWLAATVLDDSGGTDTLPGQLAVIDLATGEQDAVYDLTEPRPTCIVYSSSLDRLFVATKDTIEIVDPTDGTIEDTLELTGVHWLYWHADLEYLVAGSLDGLTVFEFGDEPDFTLIAADLLPCRFAVDGSVVYATGTSSSELALFEIDLETLAVLDTVDIHELVIDDGDTYTRLAWDAENARLWIGAVEGDLAVFSADLELVATYAAAEIGSNAAVHSLVASEGRIVVGAKLNTLYFLNGDLSGSPVEFQQTVADLNTYATALRILGDGWGAYTGSFRISDAGSAASLSFVIRYFSARGRSTVHWRKITAVTQATARVTVEGDELLPWKERESVWMINADGTRFRNIWSPLAVATYGQMEATHDLPDRRSERNLVVLPTPEQWDNDERPVGNWTVPAFELNNFEMRHREPDEYSEATYIVQVEADARGTENWQTATVRGLPGNFVMQPGDVLKMWNNAELVVAQRTVVVPAGGAYTAKDLFDGGSDNHLSAWAPTHPEDTGWTGWEYAASSSQVQIQSWGVARRVSGSDPLLARMNVDTADDNFQLTADIGRGAVDQSGMYCGVAFHCPDDAIGSWDHREFYYVSFSRVSSSTINVTLAHVTSAGGHDLVASGGVQSMAVSGGRRMRVVVEGLRCRVYISDSGTGANESLLIDATLPVDYRGSNHTRKGLRFGPAGSGDFWAVGFEYLDLTNVPDTPGSDTAVLCQSNATITYAFDDSGVNHYCRPDPWRLAERDNHFVFPHVFTSGGYEARAIFADVNIPPPTRPGMRLFLSIGGLWHGGRIPALDLQVGNGFLEYYPFAGQPSDTLFEGVATQPLEVLVLDGGVFTGAVQPIEIIQELDRDVFKPGWWRIRAASAHAGDSVPHGTLRLGTWYDLTFSVYWSTEGVPAFRRSNGGGWLWDAAQRYLVDRSSPLAHYTVRAIEENSDLPFLLGARVRLRDHERGLATDSPRIIAVRRELPVRRNDSSDHLEVDPIAPEIEIDNRPLELIAQLVSKGSL